MAELSDPCEEMWESESDRLETHGEDSTTQAHASSTPRSVQAVRNATHRWRTSFESCMHMDMHMYMHVGTHRLGLLVGDE